MHARTSHTRAHACSNTGAYNTGAFLRAVRDMGQQARVDNLYVEEVKALSQMLFTKVLPDTAAIEALSALAMERSRRVFSFCADWLLGVGE